MSRLRPLPDYPLPLLWSILGALVLPVGQATVLVAYWFVVEPYQRSARSFAEAMLYFLSHGGLLLGFCGAVLGGLSGALCQVCLKRDLSAVRRVAAVSNGIALVILVTTLYLLNISRFRQSVDRKQLEEVSFLFLINFPLQWSLVLVILSKTTMSRLSRQRR